jgi:ribonuclease HI
VESKNGDITSRGTNNQVEFQALLELLQSAKSQNIDNLHIFGDSKLVIDGMTNAVLLTKLELVNIGSILKEAS